MAQSTEPTIRINDLDAIEARAKVAMRTGDVGLIYATTSQDVPTLVAEVRRLRALVEGRALEQDALSNALPILADAADVANAWNVAGRAPAHHRSMQARLRQAWPTLARAVESLASR